MTRDSSPISESASTHRQGNPDGFQWGTVPRARETRTTTDRKKPAPADSATKAPPENAGRPEPAPPTQAEIREQVEAERLVALNHERAEEKKRGDNPLAPPRFSKSRR